MKNYIIINDKWTAYEIEMTFDEMVAHAKSIDATIQKAIGDNKTEIIIDQDGDTIAVEENHYDLYFENEL